MSNLVFRFAARVVRWYRACESEARLRRLRACGSRVEIDPTVTIWSETQMSVGDDVAIQGHTFIFAAGGVTIGRGAAVSCNCSISSATHPIPWLRREQQIEKPVHIGEGAWIGMGAIILPGVTIGDFAVVGAGSVVTHDVAAHTVVVGNPARFVRDIPRVDRSAPNPN